MYNFLIYGLPPRSAAEAIQSTPHGASAIAASLSSASFSSRPSAFITTVTAGNAIHCSCHARARSADRNHPKAPKSEWEGASLRNSRVSCNVILPLVSSKSTKVPIMSVENALADHQSIVSNLLGTRPKSMLWTVLHDVRLLLLRMSYGEALNSDCGGGSLSSNSALLFYSLFLADMFARDAEHDAPETVQHAKELSSGFLAAFYIMGSKDYVPDASTAEVLQRGLTDAAPMAALCCILFHNTADKTAPNFKKRWELYKDRFLSGLIQCAGRRHALGIDSSGCESTRGTGSGRRIRSSSFNDWDMAEMSDETSSSGGGGGGSGGSAANSSSGRKSLLGKRDSLSIDDFAKVLRPMITLYAILDQLSKEFSLVMDDEMVEESAARIVSVVESCQRADSIHSLIGTAKIKIDDSLLLDGVKLGIKTV